MLFQQHKTKNNEALITAREVEIQAVNDKYFRLLELAKQFGAKTLTNCS
jgi:hypothetical protein